MCTHTLWHVQTTNPGLWTLPAWTLTCGLLGPHRSMCTLLPPIPKELMATMPFMGVGTVTTLNVPSHRESDLGLGML